MGKSTSLRLNIVMTKELDKRLNKYCLEVAQRRGKIPFGIRAKIGRMALEEWLDKHEHNFNIEF